MALLSQPLPANEIAASKRRSVLLGGGAALLAVTAVS
jgi:hypothetical protein